MKLKPERLVVIGQRPTVPTIYVQLEGLDVSRSHGSRDLAPSKFTPIDQTAYTLYGVCALL
jgi:hypothetical protein